MTKLLEELNDLARAVEHTERFKAHISSGGRILDAPMPNGKPLGKCTGEEIGHYGVWLQESGRKLEALQRARAKVAEVA